MTPTVHRYSPSSLVEFITVIPSNLLISNFQREYTIRSHNQCTHNTGKITVDFIKVNPSTLLISNFQRENTIRYHNQCTYNTDKITVSEWIGFKRTRNNRTSKHDRNTHHSVHTPVPSARCCTAWISHGPWNKTRRVKVDSTTARDVAKCPSIELSQESFYWM